MRYVSEAAVESIISELTINRDKRRAIQGMSRAELQRYIVNIYRRGFEDGAEAVQKRLETEKDFRQIGRETEVVTVEWSDVLEAIAEIKGIGPKMLQEIDEKLREKY